MKPLTGTPTGIPVKGFGPLAKLRAAGQKRAQPPAPAPATGLPLRVLRPTPAGAPSSGCRRDASGCRGAPSRETQSGCRGARCAPGGRRECGRGLRLRGGLRGIGGGSGNGGRYKAVRICRNDSQKAEYSVQIVVNSPAGGRRAAPRARSAAPPPPPRPCTWPAAPVKSGQRGGRS